MDFKKKAGLALAMAAIFTTGGANLALADNLTADVSGGTWSGADASDLVGKTATINADALGGTDVAPTLDVSAGTFDVATVDIVSDAAVKSLAITGNVVLDGDGSGLVTVNKNTIETVTITGTLTLGDVDGGTGKAVGSAGGSLENLTVGGLTTIRGSELNVTGKFDASAAGITVGNTIDTETPALKVADLNLGGKALLVDPEYDAAPGNVSIGSFYASPTPNDPSNDKINGLLTAGKNGTIAVGTDNNVWMASILADIRETAAIDGTGSKHWFGWNNTTAKDLDITAGFGIKGPQSLLDGVGGIMVDGTRVAAAANADEAHFTADSLLVIDVTGVDDGLSNTTTGASSLLSNHTALGVQSNIDYVTIGGPNNVVTTAAGHNATLYVDNAHVGGVYTILDGLVSLDFGNGTAGNALVFGSGTGVITAGVGTMSPGDLAAKMGGNWTGENLIFSSHLLDGTWSLKDNSGSAIADLKDTDSLVLTVGRSDVEVRDIYPLMSNGMAGMVDSIYEDGANRVAWDATPADGETNNAGILFVSRLTHDRIIGEMDPALAAATLEGAAQIAVAAGVPAVTSNVLTKISSLIIDHNNLLNDTQPAYGNEPGAFGIWVNPFYATSDVDGMDAGRFESGYEMNYGGAAFGIDYNVNEAFRLGLALNVGGGDTESEGDFNKTEADFDFFGVSLYGSYTNGAFGLTGDVGFTGVDSEIDQRVPGVLGMGNFESDVDSDAFTVGLTGKYRFAVSDNFNIAPHLGLRYTKISVDDTDVNARGYGRVFDVATEDQNLFQIPLGVEFSSNIVTDGGWTVTPSADLGVLFTTGDTDVESRVRIPGTSFTGHTSSDVTDSAAFMGALGVKAAADNGLSLGLDYGILASGNQTDHQFSGMLRFEF